MLVARWRAARLVVFGAFVAAVLIGSAIPAQASFKFIKAFGPDGTSGSEFSRVASVAVDEAHRIVYVFDPPAGALYKFNSEGEPVDFGGGAPNLTGNKLSGVATGVIQGERQVAVDPVSHVVYVMSDVVEGRPKALQAFHEDGEPAVFSAIGTNKITGFSNLVGIATDEEGNFFTNDPELGGKKVQIFDEAGSLLVPNIGEAISGVGNIAVDSEGVLYVLKAPGFANPAKYTPSEYPITSATTYTFSSELEEANPSLGLGVDKQTDNLFLAEISPVPRVAILDAEGALLETFAGPGEPGELKTPEGIAPVTINEIERVYVGDNPAGGPSQVKVFIEEDCGCAPTIESSSASNVTADSATLRAKINPHNQPTTYWFEYGLNDCAVGPCEVVPAEAGFIAGGKKGILVQFALTGLQSETTYHFRAVAKNAEFVEPSPDKTFTTQGSGLGAVLSDSRAWELVSPAKKFGGVIASRDATAIQASDSGDKLAYASIGSLLEKPISNRSPEPATLLAERGSAGVWTNRELTPIHQETSLFVHGQTEFKIFTPDLLRAEMEPSEDLPLSPEATERTPYLWSDGAPPAFTPLVTPENVPPGTETSPEPSEGNRVRILAASPDLSHVAIGSKPPLVPGAVKEAVYMWSDGTIEAVSELPASEGGEVVKGTVGTGLGSVRHAVSADGSRVFWSSYEISSNEEIKATGLYLRDRAADESVRLDLKQEGASGTGEKRPAFSGASADGNVAFFTDTQRLTTDASSGGRDLYRCEIGAVEGGGLGCAELTDITAPSEGSGEKAEVIDQVPAISEDGTRLFFVARGALDEAPNEEGKTATAGEPNLYYWEEGQGVRFVATLSEEDHLVWGAFQGGKTGAAVKISAALSPNGRYFTFTSEESLTGYENRNASDALTTEVFLYDTEAEGDRLACLSCNPSGAIAVGQRLPDLVTLFPPDPGGIWAGRWVAATLPQATQTEFSGTSLYRPRAALDNGRVFFNAVDALVPGDSNGDWDVYQYEPVGVGGCAAKTSGGAVVRSGSGCVGLLSSGSAEGDAGFLDASASGDDVFFLTRTRLSVLDSDEEMDVYDARVNGIPAVIEPVRECAGEACQPSVGPPNDPTPSSESFQGAETPVLCRKGQRKVRRNGRTVCVRKKRHKHKKHRHNSAKKSGRASR